METKDWLALGGTAVVAGGVGWVIGKYFSSYSYTAPAGAALGAGRISQSQRNAANTALNRMGLTCAQWNSLSFGWQTDAVHRYLTGSRSVLFSDMPYKYSPWPWYMERPGSALASSPPDTRSLSPAEIDQMQRETQFLLFLRAACGGSAIRPTSGSYPTTDPSSVP